MSPLSSQRGPVLAALIAGAAIGWACGADQAEAPPPLAPADPEACQSFAQLMPRFVEALSTGKTEGLRLVIKEHLLVPERPGGVPPANDLFRAIFKGLSGFAQLPPEAGAAAGQSCAAVPPPLEASNPLCEMRRAMDTLVHDGKGLEALHLVDPLISGVAQYIVGQPPLATNPHYEVAAVVHDMCVQSAVCDLGDTLDLVIGFTAFSETPQGGETLARLEALVKNPAVKVYLQGDGGQVGGESGLVQLVKTASGLVIAMNDPAELDDLPFDQLPPDLRGPAKEGLGDLKALLDPAREPNVLRPLKKVLNCFNEKDKDSAVVRMLYRLALDERRPEFGLTKLLETVNGLRQIDERGTLLHLVGTLAAAVRADEQAVDSSAKVCQTLFDTRTGSTLTQSNAQLALPVVAELFSNGAAAEAICAIDSLIYGCAGGERPACVDND